MRIGILGGTFDPVHYGHLLLAESCREQGKLDAVWFLPASVPPHKQNHQISPGPLRVEMLELAIAGNPAFSICQFEVDNPGVHYTVDTLTHLRQAHPDNHLFLLLGADMLNDLPTWRNAAEVCRIATPMVAHRPGTDPPKFDCLAEIATRARIDHICQHSIAMPEMGISSSDIRRRVSRNQSIRYLTPPAVEKHIEAGRLYLTETPRQTDR